MTIAMRKTWDCGVVSAVNHVAEMTGKEPECMYQEMIKSQPSLPVFRDFWDSPTRQQSMIARLSGGTYQVLQGFHLGDDDLERIAAEVAAGRPVALDPGPLSGGHVEMVRWALAENGGRLTIANIQAYLALKPYPARMLAEEWAARGWLVKDGPAHLGRRVTGCLLELVERCEAGEWEPDAPGRFAGPVCGPQTGESADGPVCEGDL